MRLALILRLCALILLSTHSALLVSVLLVNDWAIYDTTLGPIREGLMWSTEPAGERYLDRGWEYSVFVVSFLVLALTDGILVVVAFLLLFIFKRQKRLSKYVKGTCLIPGVMMLVGMSVYTGHFTSNVAIESRGWCFWVAWFCFPCSLVAGLLEVCHRAVEENEEDVVADIPS